MSIERYVVTLTANVRLSSEILSNLVETDKRKAAQNNFYG